MLKRRLKNFIYEEEPKIEGVTLSFENIKAQIGQSDDIVFKDVFTGVGLSTAVHVAFVDGLINGKGVDDDILKPLVQESCFRKAKDEEGILAAIVKGGIYHNNMKVRETMDECIEDVLRGSVILVFDEIKKGITFEVKGANVRSVSEPSEENVIKGSKDSFVENLRINTATIRMKIKTQKLRITQSKVGRQTSTDVALVYIEEIANVEIVREVQNRINSIKNDGALSAAAIEEYIADRKFSLFPQADYTERPDKLCANVLEGRIGILIDGMPVVYIVPTTFPMMMQASEDYAFNYVYASLVRIIRYLSLIITLLLPAYYIAVTSFHIEMIPSKLVVSIINSKSYVPFPTLIEVIFMLFAFELLIEAGVRLPKTFGQAMSIVGAIVVGQAAVSAKFLSPAVIVVTSLVGISGFAIPSNDMANTIKILRIFLLLGAAVAGFTGVALGVIAIMYYMSTLESYGVPYLSPLVGASGIDSFGDTIIRIPLIFLKNRPKETKSLNSKRKK